MATSEEERVSCPICFEPYRKPQSLRCGHLLCTPCIDYMLEKNQDDLIQCSICRAVSQKHDLRRDFAMEGFVEDFVQKEAQAKSGSFKGDNSKHTSKCEICRHQSFAFLCKQCLEAMCSDCAKIHKTFRATKDHQLLTSEEMEAPIKAEVQSLISHFESVTNGIARKNDARSICSKHITTVSSDALTKMSVYKTEIDLRFKALEDKIKRAEQDEISKLARHKKEDDEMLRTLEVEKENLLDVLRKDDTHLFYKTNFTQKLKESRKHYCHDEDYIQNLLKISKEYQIELLLSDDFMKNLNEMDVSIETKKVNQINIRKHEVFGVRVDGNVVRYAGRGIHAGGEIGVFKYNTAFSKQNKYFEIEIVNPGQHGCIGIGLIPKDYPLNREPGWNKDSVGYHADDGKLYEDCPHSDRILGQTCGLGDRMGVDTTSNSFQPGTKLDIFFTRNGKKIGRILKTIPADGFYPAVGMGSKWEAVRILNTDI